MTSDTALSRRTLTQEVADRLRAAILSGELPPGRRLIVSALEEMYGVSHIPIREALRELQAEALVEGRPQLGVVVADVNSSELRDIYSLRRVIEPDVLRRSIDHYDQEHHWEFDTNLRRLLECDHTRDSSEWWQLHRTFHWAFMAPAMAPWSRRLLNLLWQVVERYQRLFVLVFGSIESANSHHQEMVRVAREEPDALIDLWLEHLAQTEEAILAGLRTVDEKGAHRPARETKVAASTS